MAGMREYEPGYASRWKEDLNLFCRDWHCFWAEYRLVAWWLAIVVFLVYGLRVTQDNFFIDSEIMFLRPEEMERQWLGGGRFGLVFTRRLFGQGRMIPYLEGAFMACFMWASGLLLSFCTYGWCGRERRYRCFLYLFPALFLVCPVFAEQYLFLLQAFEVAFAVFLCIAAVGCAGYFVYNKGSFLWALAAMGLMVWAFGSYQVITALYICLVLISFLIRYMNGDTARAWTYGWKQAAVFLAGFIAYAVVSAVVKRVTGADTDYVSSQLHWRTDDWRTCFFYIKEAVKPILKGQNIFFGKFYFPAMCLFLLQAFWYGWKKRTGAADFLCFIVGLALTVLSPFFLILVSGWVMPVRTQLVYPAASAFFMAYLTVCLSEEGMERKWQKTASVLMTLACTAQVLHSGQSMAQLFQTSWEVYRNDVLTANRIYGDICHAVGEENILEHKLIFTGGRSAEIAGPAAYGELVGLSFFNAEAHTAVGVTGRVGNLFQILGLSTGGMGEEFQELYDQACEYMKDAPDWPEQGSIRVMGDTVVVRLSE